MSNAATAGAKARDGIMPGQPDMWVLVMIEALTFSAYFVVYIFCYKQNPNLYLKSQGELSLALGVLNMMILLTSSLSIARCVERVRAGNYPAALANVWLTIAGGLTFLVVKLYEWSTEIGKGLTFTTNEFFQFYYFLTGMHLLHVLIGLGALGIIVYQLASPARRSQELVETCATYWHMVDFLWVIIFTLLYVLR